MVFEGIAERAEITRLQEQVDALRQLVYEKSIEAASTPSNFPNPPEKKPQEGRTVEPSPIPRPPNVPPLGTPIPPTNVPASGYFNPQSQWSNTPNFPFAQPMNYMYGPNPYQPYGSVNYPQMGGISPNGAPGFGNTLGIPSYCSPHPMQMLPNAGAPAPPQGHRQEAKIQFIFANF